MIIKKIEKMAVKDVEAWLMAGSILGMPSGVLLIAGGVYIAHQTGYDKKIEAEVKRQYHKGRAWVRHSINS